MKTKLMRGRIGPLNDSIATYAINYNSSNMFYTKVIIIIYYYLYDIIFTNGLSALPF